MDYAIIQIGGSQHKVSKGDVFDADLQRGQPKKSVKISKVLLYHSGKKFEVGTPYVKGASVTCDILKEGRGKKVMAYKYKRRNSSKFKRGHRQNFVTLKIKELSHA